MGWRRGRIAALVRLEAVILSVLGGALGLPASLVILRQLGSGSAAVPLQPTRLDPGTLLAGCTMLVVVGAMGRLPALRATLRLRPWTALRHGT